MGKLILVTGLLVMLLAAILTGPVAAAKSVGYEEVAATTSAVGVLTVATLNRLKAAYPDLWCTILVADYPAAYRTDGTVPTSGTKKVGQVGQIIWLEGLDDMTNFKALGVGGTSNLAVTYFTGPAR